MVVAIILVAILGGFLQATTGFGNAIVLMIVLPFYLPITSAAAVSGMICSSQNLIMAIHYRKHINFKAIIGPALCFIAGNTLTMFLLSDFDNRILKMVFGAFLIILAIFSWVFSPKMHLKANLPTMIICGFISGICEALFSIGGPLMVLFFLAITSSTDEYLGTIQAYFILVGLYSMTLRIIRGIITVDLLKYVGLGLCGMVVGLLVGSKVVHKINGPLLKKLTYVLIGIAGLIDIINAL